MSASPGADRSLWSRLRKRRANTIVFAAAATVTSLLFINLCATIFRCGCRSLWSGADAHCNIHLSAAHHCPWCAAGTVGSAIPWVLMVAVQAAISFSPRQWRAGVRLGAALAAFPLVGIPIAMAYGLAAGYWK